MVRSLSAALALTLALTAGVVATAPEPARAAVSKTALPDRQPDGATYSWLGSHLSPWSGTHTFGIGPRWTGQDFTAQPGALAFRMEYPGAIESVQVQSGPWRVESQDSNSFILTNTQPVTISGVPSSAVFVSGQFARTFVVGSMVRGDPNVFDIRSNARVS